MLPNSKISLNVQPLKASQAWGMQLEQQEKQAAKLREAAQMFEAQFVKMLMGEMRKTLANSSITSGGFGEEMFTGSLDEARADLIVQGSGLGISEMLERQLGRERYNRPAQFKMDAQAAPSQASASNAYVNQAASRSSSANNAAVIAGTVENTAEEVLKHDQVVQASHTPLMARYNELKNSRVAMDGEPEPVVASSMLWPVDSDISSQFGMRFHPILKTDRFHSGMDIKAPSGTPIQAAAEGTVVFAGNRGLLGKAVIIEHDDGRQTVYGHCSRLMVKAGQEVKQGDIIGKVGSTGRTTGPHLHFEVRDETGKATDPMLSLAPKTAREFMLADNSLQENS